jgi:predicted PurR-regulated permease PerM
VDVDLPSPITRDPWFRVLVILATLIAAIHLGQTVWGLLAAIGEILVIFIVAWLISFILEPTVVSLSRISWMPRTAAVIILYVLLLLALISAGVLLAPVLASQAVLAAELFPGIVNWLEAWISWGMSFLSARGVLPSNAPEQLMQPVQTLGTALVGNVVEVARAAASAVVQIFLVIIISLYLMLDSDRISGAVLSTVPARYRDDFIYFTSSVNNAFGGFLRGQIIQAIVYGLGIALMMLALNVKFVALASFLAGIAMFIPFIGPPLGFVPPILAALGSDAPLWLVVVLTLAINIGVVNIVGPKVMSQQIGIHPILVLGAFLIGNRIAGPWGALLGVPVAAIIVTMISFYGLTLAERKRRVLALTGEDDDEHAVTTIVTTIQEPPPLRQSSEGRSPEAAQAVPPTARTP